MLLQNPSVNANGSVPFFSSQGVVAECKAIHNMNLLMDAYLRRVTWWLGYQCAGYRKKFDIIDAI